MSGWVGFDLDGTLARYDGWRGHEHIGEPTPLAELVRGFLLDGVEVRIVTARACVEEHAKVVSDWTLKHFGVRLAVTNQKDYHMWMLFDDRAVAVEKNTGHFKCYPDLLVERKQ